MRNTIKSTLIITFLLFSINAITQNKNSKSEIDQITETLMLYINGTANGEPDKLAQAFHPDFNLYSVTKENSLRIWKGSDYVAGIKEGEKANRIGRIIKTQL